MDKPANRFYGEQRVDIKPGNYNGVKISGIDIKDRDLTVGIIYERMTADELREAAHLFVQIAEYLDNNH
ncbi:MAG: hypothetical protein [Bacteriophage sp.]|nr:MAG: hypothetical protein [Bacteriophage sp.]